MSLDPRVVAERDALLAAGAELVTMAEIERRAKALGYRRDHSGDCTCLARYVADKERCYPCLTLSWNEADTGLHAFHYKARPDANFAKFQKLRLEVFAISRGRIVNL